MGRIQSYAFVKICRTLYDKEYILLYINKNKIKCGDINEYKL